MLCIGVFYLVEILRQAGFRVTSSKLKLLSLLEKEGRPLTVQSILNNWPGDKPNETTIYRCLNDFSQAGIIKRLELNTGIAHFEYAPNRLHHHHVVCVDCGLVEEINKCSVGTLQKKLEAESNLFKTIDSHSLEFFGHCLTCSKNN